MKLCITGANSSVGQNLLSHLIQQSDVQITAGVRSERAFGDLPQADNITPTTISYDDDSSLQAAMQGANCVIHLAGILIETKHSNYASANVAATAAVVNAAKAQGVEHIIFISVIGASPQARNAYFRSKGSAEDIVTASGIASTVLRTPILLGPGTAGASSLLGAAKGPTTKVLGGGLYTMRPLDTDDLSAALVKLSLANASGTRTLELVGPEPIKYCDLIKRTAKLMGSEVEVGVVPVWVAKLGSAITSTLKGGGITPTVIDVITSDETVARNADQELGIELTSIDGTLNKILESE
ncbi:MAG: NAD(P)H-binding protein [Pseudomonadales bacterium]|nr:NAD(P)H-binding protein [Pseudomonadales bacterium]